MKRICVGVLGLLAFRAVPAQAEEPTAYVFGVYYHCNQSKEERADALFKEAFEPLLKKQVAAGNFAAYGWNKHWLGGEWRRIEYVIGNDLDKLLDGRQAYIDALLAEQKKADEELTAICSTHDDYLWSVAASSQAPADVARARGAYGASTYFVCNDDEAEADAIIKSVYAPVLNQHVKEGKIASWIWLRHMMGGKYRRALVFDGADYKSVLKYYPIMGQAIDKASPEMSERFGEICHSHSDYVWELPGKK